MIDFVRSGLTQFSSNNRGLLFFPLGTYLIDAPLQLGNVVGRNRIDDRSGVNSMIILSGEGADAGHGFGAKITGDFPDFLIRCSHGGSVTSAQKCVERLTLINGNASGGVVWAGGNGNMWVRDCFIATQNYGVQFYQAMGGHGVERCVFRSTGNPRQSVACGETGGDVGTYSANDIVGFGDAIRISGSGSRVVGNRMEVNSRGVVIGIAGMGQNITATASNGSGGTRCTIQSTAAYRDMPQVQISNRYGGEPRNIYGTWNFTVIDATHFDIPVTYQPMSTFFNVVVGPPEGYKYGGGQCEISANEFEACGYSIFCENISMSVIQANGIQGHSEHMGPNGAFMATSAGIYIRNMQNTVVQANGAEGAFTWGAVYCEPAATAGGNNVFQALNANERFPVGGSYTNTAGPFQGAASFADKLPEWLVAGLHVGLGSGNFTIPAGTVVQSVTTTTFTLSHPISGTVNDQDAFTFTDNKGNPVGGFFVR
jgi:hypothetical protein